MMRELCSGSSRTGGAQIVPSTNHLRTTSRAVSMIGRGSRFGWTLAAVLLCAFLLRLGYVLGQAATDPIFAQPVADGAYYFEWARSLATGTLGIEEGAFYRAPLYAYALGWFLQAFGENFGLLYYSQQVLMLATAAMLALAGRRLMGDAVGLAASVLFLAYHPTVFFASRPSAEPLALLLMALSLYVGTQAARWAPGVAGLASGVAALARPSLLLLAPLWALGELKRARRERAALLVGGLVLALAPTLVHNYRASGHIVPVSSNAGLTFFHGNGPGADGGMTLPLGFSGEIATQQREATQLASLQAGRPLDPVEADRWWGRRALSIRLADPVRTGKLVVWRTALLASNRELPLGDGGPSLDANPLRWATPLPFCVLLGLAAAGASLRGWRGTGGWLVWGMILACTASPLMFYVASRYRLALAAALCLPAGAGAVSLVQSFFVAGARGRRVGAGVLGGVILLSLLVPAGEMQARGEALGLVQRAWAWARLGHPSANEAELRRALELDPDSVPALFNLGRLLEETGRVGEAEGTYRRALDVFPYAPAAGNLGRLLHRSGRAEQGIPILREALQHNPLDRACWTSLVVSLTVLGQLDEAWNEAQRAVGRGVDLDPQLLEEIRRLLALQDKPEEQGAS